ncbi:MAG TPA: GyrI-like domain-containing protein [Candidatus Limnocylindrales bacterium]|jgi:effector-binding domain-containing protein
MDYVIATRELGPQDVFSIRDRIAPAEIPAFLQGAFAELFGRLGLLGVPPAGHPFVIYHAFGPIEMDAEVCVPIAGPATATGRIGSRQIPAATVARTLHVGPYEELGAAYRALTEWIEGNGFEASGPVQERYLNGPGEGVAPADFRTEVEIPVVRAAVTIPA